MKKRQMKRWKQLIAVILTAMLFVNGCGAGNSAKESSADTTNTSDAASSAETTNTSAAASSTDSLRRVTKCDRQ